jgi:hypothetical protein
MLSYRIDPDSFPFPTSRAREVDFSDRPVIALLYTISGVLLESLGPMFWAALIVLFTQAELFTS